MEEQIDLTDNNPDKIIKNKPPSDEGGFYFICSLVFYFLPYIP